MVHSDLRGCAWRRAAAGHQPAGAAATLQWGVYSATHESLCGQRSINELTRPLILMNLCDSLDVCDPLRPAHQRITHPSAQI